MARIFPPAQARKSRGGNGSPPGLEDIPAGPLEDILGRLTLQERAQVAQSSRALRTAVEEMPSYPLREEYKTLRKAFEGFKDTWRILLDAPNGIPLEDLARRLPAYFRPPIAAPGTRCIGLVLTAEFDDMSRYYSEHRLYIEVDAVMERAEYPEVFARVQVDGAPAPNTYSVFRLFQDQYDEQAITQPGLKETGTTAMEAFLDGAQLLGSFHQPVMVHQYGHGDGHSVLAPILERCGVPAGKVQPVQIRNENLPSVRLPRAGIPGRVTLRVLDPVNDYILHELVTDSGLDLVPERLPLGLRLEIYPPANLTMEEWKKEKEKNPIPPFDLVMEADGGAEDLRLLLGDAEIWSETDPEEMPYSMRDILQSIFSLTKREGSISIEGSGPLAQWVVENAMELANAGMQEYLAKNYRRI